MHGKRMVAEETSPCHSQKYRINASPERKRELMMYASTANVSDVTAGTCAAGLRGEPASLPPCRVPRGTERQGPSKLGAQSSTQPLGARLAQQPGQVSAALQGPRRSQIPFSGWELGKKKWQMASEQRAQGSEARQGRWGLAVLGGVKQGEARRGEAERGEAGWGRCGGVRQSEAG